MGLRGEAGERDHDLNGGDPDGSANASGYSKETKVRYYKKVSYEEAIESFWGGIIRLFDDTSENIYRSKY